MHFTKMQGAGNDYVYVDCFSQPMPRDPAALSRAVSDRHFGIGSDGLILICPSAKADARMVMFNADGSESEMCGNGIRCVAKYVHDRGLACKPELTIETGRGVLTLELQVKDGKAHQVRVDMGEPILEAARIPTTLPGDPPVDCGLRIANCELVGGSAIRNPQSAIELRVTCVSMGNPHCVTFVDAATDALVLGVGPRVERHEAFPRRTNVEFVQVRSPDEVTVRVWER